MARGIKWPAEEVQVLRDRYPHEHTAELAKAMGKTLKQIQGQAEVHGLKKTPEYKAKYHAKRKDVGATRTDRDGYVKVKVAQPDIWKRMHVYNWETAYGPVPDGCVLWFKDGNGKNAELCNLECITKREAMARTSRAHLPPEENSEISRRAWETRREKKRMRRRWVAIDFQVPGAKAQPRFVPGKAWSGSK